MSSRGSADTSADRPPERPGTATTVVTIGDLPLRLILDGLRVDPASPIASFLTPERTDHVSEMRIRLGTISSAADEVLFDSGGVWRAVPSDNGPRFEFSVNGRVYRTVALDSDLRSGHSVIDTTIVGPEPDPLGYPFDELLVNHLLARHGGIEIHAVGLVDQGRGILCVGHSGAGKSTIGRLWLDQHPDTSVLSDDRIIIRRDGSGAMRIWGTPWHGEAMMCEASSAPLDRIFVLRQAKENAVRRLPAPVAAAELLSRSFYPVYDPRAVEQATGFVASLVEEVPVYDLSFRRDSAAVDLARSC